MRKMRKSRLQASLTCFDFQILDIHSELSDSKLHWKIRLGIGLALGGIFGLVYVAAKRLIARP